MIVAGAKFGPLFVSGGNVLLELLFYMSSCTLDDVCRDYDEAIEIIQTMELLIVQKKCE